MSSKTVKLAPAEDAPFIEVTQGGKKGQQYRLNMDIMSLGRGDDNDIILPSESVSRCHGFLKRTPQGWLLQDNRSRNGMMLNGKKVIEGTLASGDKIQIGEFGFRFEDPKAAQALKASLRVEVPAPGLPSAVPANRRKPQKTKKANLLDQTQVFYLSVGVAVGLVLASLTAVRLSKKRVVAKNAASVSQGKRMSNLAVPTPEEVLRDAEIAAANNAPSNNAQANAVDSEVSRDELKVKPKRRGPRDDKAELVVYLKEGKDYFLEGDMESATMAFRFALVIDPQNQMASDGLKMIEDRKSKRAARAQSSSAPTRKAAAIRQESTADKRRLVSDMLKTAQQAFTRRSYQEAINTAEKIRRIEVKNETLYLNEAKQIIDKARFRQKEDVEPFLEQARQKLLAGDFQSGRDLCEEMVRMDPAYTEARECLIRAEEGLRTVGMRGMKSP